MTEPIQITEDYLFAKIGRLQVEVELLRAQLAAQEAAGENGAGEVAEQYTTS